MSARRSPAKPSILQSHSFYVRIVTIFVGLLVVTALSIVSYNYYKNSLMALEMGDDLMDRITKSVMEKANNYFSPAGVLVEMSARLSEMGALSLTDSRRIELYTLGVLKSYPHISMFFFGDEQGNYIRAWALPDGTMEGRIVERNLPQPANTFKYWDGAFKVFKTEKSATIDYDPRVRPWYIGAKEAKKNYWTDSYILFRNKKPAITSASPVIDPKGNILGVWGVDIELDEISTFLKQLKIGKNGIALILNQKHEVVAYPDISLIVKEENGTLRPIWVEELGLEHVSAAFREHIKTGDSKSVIESHGTRYLASFSDFPKSFHARWKVAVVAPEDDFIGGAKQLIRETLLICMVILVMAILLAVLVTRSISKPIRFLAEETRKIKDFNLDDKVAISSRIKEIQLMSHAISAMKAGLQAFRRYVPAELVRRLIDTGEEARLGGHQRELTVFFSDISGFTTIAEAMSPEALMLYLSEYLDELTKILSAEQGTVDKYIGDGIMAFWGAPVHDDDHAFHACAAALACQEKLRELNKKWQSQGKSPLATRIGIATGETVVGNVGSSERINYTVMGDNVNLASRLEGVNKLYRTKIMVSQATCEAVADKFWFRPLGIVAVKGKREGTAIYELAGRKEEGPPDAAAQLCREFARGFEAYLARDWDGALEIFGNLWEKFPADAPTELFLSRCRHYRDNPPGPDWQGIEYLESK
ncbi:MAG: adenylate/guanylate cyclase domain-containing protein [Candidatus Margulisiibacteriota bacterium]